RGHTAATGSARIESPRPRIPNPMRTVASTASTTAPVVISRPWAANCNAGVAVRPALASVPVSAAGAPEPVDPAVGRAADSGAMPAPVVSGRPDPASTPPGVAIPGRPRSVPGAAVTVASAPPRVTVKIGPLPVFHDTTSEPAVTDVVASLASL